MISARSWPRDLALEGRILAIIDDSSEGMEVSELAAALKQDFSRVQLSCWDLCNASKIEHALPSQRYVRVA